MTGWYACCPHCSGTVKPCRIAGQHLRPCEYGCDGVGTSTHPRKVRIQRHRLTGTTQYFLDGRPLPRGYKVDVETNFETEEYYDFSSPTPLLVQGPPTLKVCLNGIPLAGHVVVEMCVVEHLPEEMYALVIEEDPF